MDQVQSEQPNAPVEAEPRYVSKTTSPPASGSRRGRSWFRTLGVVLAGLVLVVALVFFARWVYHKTHQKTQPAPATSQKTPAKSSQNKAPKAPAPNNSGSSSTPRPGSNASGTSPQIANTGPGDVAALFVGTSLAAAGLHYIISIRRFNRSGA